MSHFCLLPQYVYICQFRYTSLNTMHTTGFLFKQNMTDGCTNNVHNLYYVTNVKCALKNLQLFKAELRNNFVTLCLMTTNTKVEARTDETIWVTEFFQRTLLGQTQETQCGREVSEMGTSSGN